MLLALLFAVEAANGPLLEPLSKDQRWLDEADYPSSELLYHRGGVAEVKLIINPAGMPEQCILVSSSGNDAINKTVCEVSMKRLRFKPPTSTDGKAVYGIWQRQAVLLPPGTTFAPKAAASSIFKFSIDTPGIVPRLTQVRTIVAVDVSGSIVDCARTSYAPNDYSSDGRLAEVACK